MIGIMLFFILWCVIIGFLVRWELNKPTPTQIAFKKVTQSINDLGISFKALIEPTRKAAEAFEEFGKAYERSFNVPG